MTAIVVHGGAGAVPAERHGLLRASVRAAAAAGNHVLATGGSALDAVVAAVRVMEDDPELNAGTGSVLTIEGTVETDAAVMTGHDRRVGAVGAVPEMGCAVALARAVLERREHVLISGEGALAFAREVGIPIAPEGSLVTERQRERLRTYMMAAGPPMYGPPPYLDPALTAHIEAVMGAATVEEAQEIARRGPFGDSGAPDPRSGATDGEGTSRGTGTGTDRRTDPDDDPSDSRGTVGAVARDRHGHFAAATSTGGMIGKRSGRIGDSPIAGAGTWADTDCAISATGDGEAILRVTLARLVAFSVSGGLARSAHTALAELVAITRGSAGLIAIDRTSRVTLRQSKTMPVAWVDAGGAGDSLGDDA